MDKNERIWMGIQLESKRNKSNKPLGFAMIDEHIVKMFCHYIHMKIERMLAKKEAQVRERNVVETIQLTSDICTQRSHQGIIEKLKDKLPSFMEFDSVGVLLYDKNNDKLFSIVEETKEGSTETVNTIIRFPWNLGITGIVFQSGKLYISNNATKETKMRSDIDNLSSCTDVQNFMIGPIYGDDKKTPIGLVQFFNKLGKEGITDLDQSKFDAIQGLLGMCVDNTNEMSLTMSVTHGLESIVK